MPRLGDMMVQNKGSPPNTAPFPEIQPPVVVIESPIQEQQSECMKDAAESGSPFVESAD